MKITKKEVLHVAHLARLTLSAEELEKMTGQLDNILSYFDKLGKLDTADIPATSHVFSVNNAFREDEVLVPAERRGLAKLCTTRWRNVSGSENHLIF